MTLWKIGLVLITLGLCTALIAIGRDIKDEIKPANAIAGMAGLLIMMLGEFIFVGSCP